MGAKTVLSKEIMVIIKEAAEKAVAAEVARAQAQGKRVAEDFSKAIERRVEAHAMILAKIEADKVTLQELKDGGKMSGRSKDLVRFNRSTTRLSQEEIRDVLIKDLTATIAADQYEADTIAGALRTIEHDPYYAVIAGRFIEGKTNEYIAEQIHCDTSTAARNRGRLMRALAVRLYGAAAL